MGQSNHSGRIQRLYIEDNKAKVHPINCVPEQSKRPKGSWTNGVKAWRKGIGGANDEWVGWFAPPRFRKGKSMDKGSFKGFTFDSSEE